MDKLQILQKLTGLVKAGTSKADIEREAQLPKNSLSSVLTGVKEMPNKWVEKFGGYFERMQVKADTGNLAEKYSPEMHEIVKNIQFVKPGFTKEMAKKGILLNQIEAFCAKKGFPPSELIEKFEGLEARIKMVIEQKQEVVDAYGAHLEEDQSFEKSLEKALSESEYRKRLMQANKNLFTYGFAIIPDDPNEPIVDPLSKKGQELIIAHLSQNKPNTAPEIEKRIQDTPEWQKGKEGAENSAGNEEQAPEGLAGIPLMVWKNEQKKKLQGKKPPQTTFGSGKNSKDPFDL